jgi:hypothetical protein
MGNTLVSDRNSRKLSADYVSGLFDGEGSITIVIGGNKRRYPAGVLVRISQKTGNSILHLLEENFGGAISSHNWRLSGMAATSTFLRMIQPSCVIKASAIQIALEFNTLLHRGLNGHGSSIDEKQMQLRWQFRQRLIEVNAEQEVLSSAKAIPNEDNKLIALRSLTASFARLLNPQPLDSQILRAYREPRCSALQLASASS